MKQEFINNSIPNRKALIYRLLLALGIVFLFYFFKYFFAPEDYYSGKAHSRTWISYNDLVITITIAIVIIIPVMAMSRIVQKLAIDFEGNELIIGYIGRLRFKPTSVTVKLSETQVQIEEIENKNGYTKSENIYNLYLTNLAFGTMKVSGQDFQNIHEICTYFQQIKDTAAVMNRRSRLRMRKR